MPPASSSLTTPQSQTNLHVGDACSVVTAGFKFYAKADIDTYVVNHNLALALDTLPR